MDMAKFLIKAAFFTLLVLIVWQAALHLPSTPRTPEPKAAPAASEAAVPAKPVGSVPAKPDPAPEEAQRVEPPKGEGQLRVTVRNREGEFVPGVPVLLELVEPEETAESSEPRAQWEGQTEEGGRTSFIQLPWGRYNISAWQGELAGRTVAGLNLERPVAQPTIVLRPGGTIRGSVVDMADKPVPGAVVELATLLRELIMPVRGVCDEQGQFLFEGVPIGRYQVQASAEGYAPEASGEVAVDGQPLQIRLDQGGGLAATVRSAASSQPAPDITVKIEASDLQAFKTRAVADAQGKLAVQHLPPGRCQLISDDPRYALRPVRTEVEIVPGRITTAELLVEEGANISGTIFDGDTNEPIAGAIVTASNQSAQMHFWESQPSDANGRYIIAGLPSGNLGLMVRNAPRRFGMLVSRDMTQNVGVAVGEKLEGVNFKLSAGRVVEGQVVDEAGEPVTQVAVYMSIVPGENSDIRIEQGLTDSEGRFAYANLGKISVTLQAKSESGRTEAYGPLPVPADGLSGIVLTLSESNMDTVSGTLVDSGGKPMLAHVLLQRTDEPNRIDSGFVTTDVDGFFLVQNLGAGAYEILAASYSTTGLIGNKSSLHKLTLTEGQHVRNLRLVLHEGGSITGRVLDAEGNPVWGHTVHAVNSEDQDDFTFAMTDRDGNFVLSNLKDVPYEVAVPGSGRSGRQVLSPGEHVEVNLGTTDEEAQPDE